MSRECIHQLFEEQVEKTPEAVAAIFAGEQLTYRELNRRANQLAHYLRSLGVGAEVLVGICVERSLEMLVGLLGILKAGGAYVPLDPAYPRERLAFMLQDASLSIVVTQEKLVAEPLNLTTPAKPNLKLVRLDDDWVKISQHSYENPDNSSTDNLAYVIYTSGSTGKPKGVQIDHKSVANFLNGMRLAPGLSDCDTLIAVTTISFDISVLELYLPLITGACCILVRHDVSRDANQLMKLIDELHPTVMQATPSTWRMLLEAGWQGNKQLKILCGGESLTRDLAEQLLEKCAELWNMYGPTEATVWATIHQIQPGVNSIPIGRPIANTQIYILDPNHKQVPIGEPGELHVGGAGLARGYLNRRELTEEKFIANPFDQKPDSRLYKTGDLARYLQDGNIEFLGRIDHQVKIRGYRIELGEIETTLSQHPDVKQVVVIAREDIPNQKRLVAYLVAGSSSDNLPETEAVAKQTEQWQKIWDDAYIHSDSQQEPSFHIGGWKDSYTGKDLEPEQVQEWVNSTVERILSLQPNRLLEIGCGTGLLLFRIAPQCQHYYATDLSGEAIRYLERQIGNIDVEQASCLLASSVTLRQIPAEGLAEIISESFDTAISNSVIQYFPNIDYLVQVIKTAVELVEPVGQIFLGDVLSLPLLEAFHTSVQLEQAPTSLSVALLKQRIGDRLLREQRLIIDPEFFIALKEYLPQISHVEIQLKRGRYQNELTRFRYDVVLHLGKKAPLPTTPPIYLNWEQDNLTAATIRQQLVETSPEILIVTHIPNARIWADVQAMEWLASPDCPETVGKLRQQIGSEGIEPEDWWEWQSEVAYRINITWSGNGGDGYYDVVFVRNDTKIIADSRIISNQKNPRQPWSTYANQPYTGTKHSQLVPQLRDFLKEKLPGYMIPSAFVLLEELPLTPNGKVDRRALPAPDKSRPVLDVELVTPRTPTEAILAGIWAEVLSLNEIGVLDNFFMLGGDSIQATQLISRVRDTFQIELSLHRLFEAPTVAELSETLDGASRQQFATIRPIPRNGELPLSFAEQRLWFLDQLQEGSIAYNEQEALRLRGSLHIEALQRAVQEIVRRHEVLRTNYQAIDGSPVRVILPELNLKMPIINLQQLPPEEQLSEVQSLGNQEIQQPFDLAHDPLLRVTLLQLATDDYVLLLTMHHIISDGWSTSVFGHELEVLYRAYVQGKPSPLPQLSLQYADFASWQRQPQTSQMLAPQLDYWKQQLLGAPPLLELPTDYPRPMVQTYRGEKAFFELGVELTVELKRLSQGSGVTLFMTLLAGFSTLLYRYSNQEDIIVGTPIANRNRSEIEGLIGFFVNTLALRSRVEGTLEFTELLQKVRQTALDAYAYQDLPFEQLVEALQPERSLSHSPIFQVMFALQNAPMAPLDLPGVSFKWLQMENAKAKFDLFLSMEETEAGLTGYWEYNCDLFEAATIHRMIGHFQTLLKAIVATPQTRIDDLTLLTETECYQLLVEWNNIQTNYPQNKCIYQLFEEQVERTPDAVAVVFENEQLTYRELNDRANQLACYLQHIGITSEVLVGICLERSLEMVVGLLGILKAGGAYVPLDPTYPQERLAFMLSDSQVPVLLTVKSLTHKLPQTEARLVYLDADWEVIETQSNANPEPAVTPENLAYVIYTSGSTGKPKGVLVTHQNLVHSTTARIHHYQEALTRYLLLSSFAFDSSVAGIFWTLSVGATLVLPSHNFIQDTPGLIQLIQTQSISHLLCLPSLYALLLEQGTSLELASLQVVIVAGEACQQELVNCHGKLLSETALYNEYGPTEATVWSSFYKCKPQAEPTKVPIGRAIANTQIYLLDANLQPVPVGVTGEIYIGGAGITRGYLNREQLNVEKFIANPFSSQLQNLSSPVSDRLYKTGDLARYLPDGNLEFIGRTDNQVKVRGFRIELGEIEVALTQHPDLAEAVVIAREDTPGDKRLVAYLVTGSPGMKPSEAKWRTFLKTKLPDYMVPSAFVCLAAMPLTPNGKVDRRALPAPDISSLTKQAGSISPRNLIELQLTQVWADVLNVASVGVTDNFFALGGHSLLAVRLMARIQQQLGKNLPLATLFQSSTIEEQAKLLDSDKNFQLISPLVKIKSGRDLPPLFLIPPSSGQVLFYVDLARNLQTEQPIYGLQLPGLNGELEPMTTLEELAAYTIQAIKAVCPHGPYYLVGFCVGGLLAYEIAQQLNQQGETLALLAMIETHSPKFHKLLNERMAAENLGNEIYYAISFAEELSATSGKKLSVSTKRLQQMKPLEQLEYILEQAKLHNILPEEVGMQQMQNLYWVYHATGWATYNYEAQPYGGAIKLFNASQPLMELTEDATLGWGDLVTGQIEVYQITGDHYSIIREPDVQRLTEKLAVCLC